jgi:hypothetical protein
LLVAFKEIPERELRVLDTHYPGLLILLPRHKVASESCIQRNPRKGIESRKLQRNLESHLHLYLYIVAFNEIPERELRVLVAFKEIPERELRVLYSTRNLVLHSKKSHKGN